MQLVGDRMKTDVCSIWLLNADRTRLTMAAARGLAEEAVGDWRLTDCDLYVTKEPCPMCAGALQQARVGRVVFGADDPKAGACGSLYHLGADPRLNHEFDVQAGVEAEACGVLLRYFFAARR